MTNEFNDIVFDGGLDSIVGSCIALAPIFASLIILHLSIHGVIRKRFRGTPSPFPKALFVTSTFLLAGDTFAFLWWTGFTLMSSNSTYPYNPQWQMFWINFGHKLCGFSWMLPVAASGYISAVLLKSDKDPQPGVAGY